MGKKTLITIFFLWCLISIIEYYFLPYFINVIIWLTLSLCLLLITISLLIKVIHKIKSASKLMILRVVFFAVLFFLTFYAHLVNSLFEKINWAVFYAKRQEIVERVKNNELKPNVSFNKALCKLPFNFPVLSNSGNEIYIFRNNLDKSITVKFWIARGFFEAPQTYFTFSDDIKELKALDQFITTDPNHNWKINRNWYRTSE
jgi:hypothetical protein